MSKRITITTEFTAEVPDSMSADAILDITMEVPFEKIRIDSGGGPVVGAKITSYTTIDVAENS